MLNDSLDEEKLKLLKTVNIMSFIAFYIVVLTWILIEVMLLVYKYSKIIFL